MSKENMIKEFANELGITLTQDELELTISDLNAVPERDWYYEMKNYVVNHPDVA